MVLGIDVAKASFDVALLTTDKPQHKMFSNTEAGFEALKQWLEPHDFSALHVCMEATNVYGLMLATYLHNLGCKVSIVNPARIKAYASSRLSRNKTDRMDALLIADFCERERPRLWQPPQKAVLELRSLLRRYDDLKNIILMEENRLTTTTSENIRTLIADHLRFLEEQLQALQVVIDDHINASKDLKKQQTLLISIPGIAKLTARRLMVELNLHSFDCVKQFVAYVGLNPRQYQSGQFKGKTRLSKVGCAALRKALYLPAVAALKWNPPIQALAERLRAKGKCEMVCVGAAMRKLVHQAYGVLQSDKPFDPKIASAKAFHLETS
jgi:transposase